MTRVYVVLPYTAVTLNALTAFTHIVKLCVAGTFFHVCCVVTCIREVYVMARCITNMNPLAKDADAVWNSMLASVPLTAAYVLQVLLHIASTHCMRLGFSLTARKERQ
jgi:hypothetical protein